jgi:hypothetical protein
MNLGVFGVDTTVNGEYCLTAQTIVRVETET